MTCEELEALIFSGRALTEDERKAAQAHAETCGACRVLLEQLDVLSGARELDADVEVPESFKRGWRAACREKVTFRQKVRNFFRSSSPMLGRAAAYACCAVVLFGAGALMEKRASLDDMTYAMERSANSYRMEEEYTPETYMAEGQPLRAAYGMPMARSMPEPDEAERQIVRTADIELKTEQLDSAVEALCSQTEALGGSVASCEIAGEADEGRTAWLELRVPAEKLDGMLSDLGGLGSVTHSRVNAEDMTEYVQDNASRLESAQAKKAQLDALYQQAEDMEDMLLITDALFEVQQEMERLSGENTRIKDRAALSRVHVTLEETVEQEEEDRPFFPALAESFREGLSDFVTGAGDFLMGLAYGLPGLVTIGLIGWGSWHLVKKIRRRK